MHTESSSSSAPPSKLMRIKQYAMQSWLVRGVISWLDADSMRISAAMAFYAMLSLAPLLILIVAGLGWWVDRSMVEETMIHQVEALAGARTAAVVQQALLSATAPAQGLIASIIAFAVLLSAATGVFVALQDSLKSVWGIPKSQGQPWWWLFVLRLRGVGYLMVLGGLLMLSLILSTVLRILSKILGDYIAYPWVWSGLNEAASFLFVMLLFVGLMRISDGKKPSLRYLIRASAIGAVLFTFGKHAMTVYLSGAAAVSAYGAAGSLVALLMWLYFSCAILLLTASLAKAMSDADHASFEGQETTKPPASAPVTATAPTAE